MRNRPWRALFRRREEIRFLRPDRSLSKVIGTATALAGPRGTDELDLLRAALAAKPARKTLRMLGIDAQAIADAAALQQHVVNEPGLTDDAKRVFEALSHRCLERQRNGTVVDLLVALVSTPGRAQAVMREMGAGEAELASIID
jgi:hypothetical protein